MGIDNADKFLDGVRKLFVQFFRVAFIAVLFKELFKKYTAPILKLAF